MQAQAQSQTHNWYIETDNRDWRARSAQSHAVVEEKSWDNIREAKEPYASSSRQQEQVNIQDYSQFASKSQVPSRYILSVFHYLSFSLYLINAFLKQLFPQFFCLTLFICYIHCVYFITD
jgi:hypothetical protein